MLPPPVTWVAWGQLCGDAVRLWRALAAPWLQPWWLARAGLSAPPARPTVAPPSDRARIGASAGTGATIIPFERRRARGAVGAGARPTPR
jgi:hypothetical protein